MESNLTFDPDANLFLFNIVDPDPTYAMTYDNLVKMMAIQMRFRYTNNSWAVQHIYTQD